MAKDKKEEIVEENTVTDYNDYEEVSIEERILNIEKKANASFILNIVILVVTAILLVLVVAGGVGNGGSSSGSGESTGGASEEIAYDTSAFKTIKPADIKELSNGKTIVVWVGRQNCGYCAAYAPFIEQATKDYGITAMYIDLATMVEFNVEQPYITDAEAYNTLSSLGGKGEWETFAYDNVTGTPMTLIIKNNKVIGGISGYLEVDGIKEAFDAAGIKKK